MADILEEEEAADTADVAPTARVRILIAIVIAILFKCLLGDKHNQSQAVGHRSSTTLAISSLPVDRWSFLPAFPRRLCFGSDSDEIYNSFPEMLESNSISEDLA